MKKTLAISLMTCAVITFSAPARAGAPAARVGDMHTCPMITGVVPHLGGPVLPGGAANVLICGKPAARVGDKAGCAGPVDTIVKGSATVLIGGKPAATLGATTAHGGRVTAGCPSVQIGG